MNNVWLAKARRHFNFLKTSLNVLNKPDKTTPKNNATSSCYNKPIRNYKYIRNKFLESAIFKELWNHFRFKEMKILASWKGTRVSSSVDNQNSTDQSELMSVKSVFNKKVQCHLQCHSTKENEKFFEEKSFLNSAEYQPELYISRSIIRNRILRWKVNNDLHYIQVLFYFGPQYISWQSFQEKNYEKIKNYIISNVLKWPRNTSILNIDVPVNPFRSFIWDFNENFIISNGLNFFTIHENGESDDKKEIDKKSNDRVKKSTDNPLDYKLKTKVHSRRLAVLIAKLLNTNTKNITKDIYKHPKKLFVPTEQVEDTYNCLKKKGYDNIIIQDCPTVLFYRKEYVENTLNFLETQDLEEKNNGNTHAGLQLRLHLCVYYMEKPFHFSGEGIFPPDDAEKM